MDQVSPELAREVLRLMIQDSVTLAGDLHQCERAAAAWVRTVGAATIEAHLAGKKRLRRIEPAVRVRGKLIIYYARLLLRRRVA